MRFDSSQGCGIPRGALSPQCFSKIRPGSLSLRISCSSRCPSVVAPDHQIWGKMEPVVRLVVDFLDLWPWDGRLLIRPSA